MVETVDVPEPEAPFAAGHWPLVVDLLADGVPLEVGQFELGTEGRLSRRGFDLPLHFDFAYRGTRFDCSVDLSQEAAVSLAADLTRLPFTAQSPAGRARALRLLAGAGELASGRLSLAEGGWIRYEGGKAPPRPCTPACVMASVVALILELQPTLDLLREAVGPAWAPPT